jgi:hypothetical protein
MRKQFVFNPAGASDDDIEYTGAVALSERKTIATIAYEADRVISLENTGGPQLSFSLRVEEDTPSGQPKLVDTSDGPNDVAMSDLNSNPAAMLLVVENNESEPAEYKVVLG